MLQESPDNLDALIREEKYKVAVEFFQEAWKNAIEEGIEPSILATSGVFAILSQLQSQDGDAAVAALVAELPDRHESGHFDVNRVLQ